MSRLEEIKLRCEKATPGPWEYDGINNILTVPSGSEEDGYVSPFTAYLGELKGKDIKFIAHAREDIPWLLTEVERLYDNLNSSNAKLSLYRHMVGDLTIEVKRLTAERDVALCYLEQRLREIHACKDCKTDCSAGRDCNWQYRGPQGGEQK